MDGLGKNNAAQTLVGAAQIAAVFAVMWMKSGNALKAFVDILLVPVSYWIFLAMVGNGLMGAWFRRGTVWKGRVVQTRERLPKWDPKPPKARSIEPPGEPPGALG